MTLALAKTSVPTTMRAAAIDQFGPPKVLTLHTLPTPKPGTGEVLIAMHPAGVGVWDAEAHAQVERGHVLGRIVLRMQQFSP